MKLLGKAIALSGIRIAWRLATRATRPTNPGGGREHGRRAREPGREFARGGRKRHRSGRKCPRERRPTRWRTRPTRRVRPARTRPRRSEEAIRNSRLINHKKRAAGSLRQPFLCVQATRQSSSRVRKAGANRARFLLRAADDRRPRCARAGRRARGADRGHRDRPGRDRRHPAPGRGRRARGHGPAVAARAAVTIAARRAPRAADACPPARRRSPGRRPASTGGPCRADRPRAP